MGGGENKDLIRPSGTFPVRGEGFWRRGRNVAPSGGGAVPISWPFSQSHRKIDPAGERKMALFERSEFSHFSRCKSPPPPDSDDFPRRRVVASVGHRCPQRSSFGSRRAAMLSRGRALGGGPSPNRKRRCAPGWQARRSFPPYPPLASPLASGVQHNPQATRPQHYLGHC